MRYIVDIPRWLDMKIKTLLSEDSSGYVGVEEFVIVACENQLKLESTSPGEEHLQGEGIPSPAMDTLTDNLTPPPSDIPTTSLPRSEKVESHILWGQINRIFPVKLAVRVLANVIKDAEEENVDIVVFERVATHAAREFGARLAVLDERHMRKSGRKLATGLPTGVKADQSKKRYKAHYLARRTGKGELVGALGELSLANINRDRIGITELGLEFAQLENPLLDLDIDNPSNVLSDEERSFYLNLVSNHLPKEKEFMGIVLNIIMDGEPPRDRFIKEVQKFVTTVWEESSTEAVANTMRSGVLSRMWELGLVDNRKKGRRVAYSISDEGREYLSKGGK